MRQDPLKLYRLLAAPPTGTGLRDSNEAAHGYCWATQTVFREANRLNSTGRVKAQILGASVVNWKRKISQLKAEAGFFSKGRRNEGKGVIDAKGRKTTTRKDGLKKKSGSEVPQ